MPSAASDSTSLIGRERELARFQELLDNAIAGSGSLALVGGEAGIGKTTLVRRFTQLAADRGCLALSGGCYDLTTTPPYGPWAETIRDYAPSGVQPTPPIWFNNPEEMAKVGNQPALFEELRLFYAGIASQQPLLIVLEDLHWVDPATPEALRYLARSVDDLPLCIVATYRDDEMTRNHPFFETIPMLVREAETHRVDLRRWQHADTGALIVNRYQLPAGDSERLTGYTQELAEGNPFFTMELLHTLESDGVLRLSGEHWELGELRGPLVPPLVRQVIERRLDRLSNDTHVLLEIAAVIGQQPSFDLWQAVAGVTDGQVMVAVDEATQSHLIDELPDRSGIQFRHALVREALYASLPALRLRNWHRQVADALIDQPAPDPDEVAYHLGEAGDAREVEWLFQAGERAERSYAWETAKDRYESAAELLEHDPDRLLDRGWLLFEISELCRYSDLERGIACAAEASRIGNQFGDHWLVNLAIIREEATLRQVLEGQRYDIHRHIAAVRQIDAGIRSLHDETGEQGWQQSAHRVPAIILDLQKYLESVDVPDSAPLNVHWGATLNYLEHAGQLEEARVIGEAYLPVVRWAFSHLPITVSQLGYNDAVSNLATTNAMLGHMDVALDLATTAVKRYVNYGHRWMVEESTATVLETIAFPYFADRPDVQLIIDRLIGDRQPACLSPRVGRAVADVVHGRWKEARATSQHMLESSVPLALMRNGFLTILAYLDWRQGNYRQAWERIHASIQTDPAQLSASTCIWDAVKVRRTAIGLALDSGDLDTAAEWIAYLRDIYDRTGAVLGKAQFMILSARHDLMTGDSKQARLTADRALELASDPRQPLALIDAHRFLGTLLIDERDDESAASHLATSLQIAEACQAPFEIALTRLELARLATATGDIQQASHLLDRARNTFDELGARPALRRADQLASELQAKTQSYPDGLTPREAEVLALVAGRLSNREIAERLHLSVRTVERHITNIYTKIGVHNRYDAGDYALRHNIVMQDSADRTSG